MRVDSFTLEDLEESVEVRIIATHIHLENGVPRIVMKLAAVDSNDERWWLYTLSDGELGRLM